MTVINSTTTISGRSAGRLMYLNRCHQDAPSTLELGNLARCQALDWTYSGEYFTYLLTKSDPGRTNAYVGWSTNPLRDVCQLNARQDNGGGWELAAVVALWIVYRVSAMRFKWVGRLLTRR